MDNVDEIQKQVFDWLDIDEKFLPVVNNTDDKYQVFRNLLIRRIEELAEKDMEKLLWVLYRVDVSEKKLHEVMQQTPPELFSSTIADLIIERQKQKVESRKKYGTGEEDWSFDV